eukprot:SAG31_NODE_3609_length_4070_cov_2.814153_6_plen_167_part_01
MPKKINMKVSGMGISLLDANEIPLPDQNYLYVHITGWRYSRSEQHLVVELSDKISKTGKAANMYLGTKDGEEIGLLMRNHAASVATVMADQRKAEKAAAEKADAERMTNMKGSYRIDSLTTRRTDKELDSEKLDDLAAGETIEVIGAEKNTAGSIRLKLADDKGWIS